jgi:hypothetical protein
MLLQAGGCFGAARLFVYETFRSDIDLQDAFVPHFEIIGEWRKGYVRMFASADPMFLGGWRSASETCLFMTIRTWSLIPSITWVEKTCPRSARR